MGNLEKLIADGTVTIEELEEAPYLLNRAKLVMNGMEACKKTIKIPEGKDRVHCYSFMAHGGDYEAIGYYTLDDEFICESLGDGGYEVGRCNMTSFKDIFLALGDYPFASDLKLFLETQIREAEEQQ